MSDIKITRDTNRVTRKIVFPISPSILAARHKPPPPPPPIQEIDYGPKEVPKDFVFTYFRPTTPPPRKSRSRSRSPPQIQEEKISQRSRSPKKIKREYSKRNNKKLFDQYFRLNIQQQIQILNCLIGEAIKKVYLHPVQYQHVWEPKPFSEQEFEEIFQNEFDQDNISDYDDDEEEKLFPKTPYFQWSDLAFGSHIQTLHISSESNGNDDIRGGGCGQLNIPTKEFSWTIQNSNGITFQNLVEAVYRMKGSKYDWWYEIYEQIEIDNKQTSKKKEIHIVVYFGYGS